MVIASAARGNLKSRQRETEVVFGGLIDEETVQAGSRALAAGGFKADLAIVGEPTRLQVVTAHKGSLWLELATRGRAAHGAAPQFAKNPVHELAHIVAVIEMDYAPPFPRPHPPLTAPPPAHPAIISAPTPP